MFTSGRENCGRDKGCLWNYNSLLAFRMTRLLGSTFSLMNIGPNQTASLQPAFILTPSTTLPHLLYFYDLPPKPFITFLGVVKNIKSAKNDAQDGVAFWIKNTMKNWINFFSFCPSFFFDVRSNKDFFIIIKLLSRY